MTPLGHLHVGPDIANPRFPQLRRCGLGEQLVDAAAKHQVAAEQQQWVGPGHGSGGNPDQPVAAATAGPQRLRAAALLQRRQRRMRRSPSLQTPAPVPPSEPLPPWRPLLRGAREREGRSPAARWLQLATVAVDGSPRVRTLVFRGWAAATSLDLLTDGRSAKPAELLHQPAVELCWLLPRARSQFRLRGRVLTLDSALNQAERERHWQGLSPGGRALWGWPEPGAPFSATAPFPAELADDIPMPACFQLLRIGLEQVELLELGDHPHHRRRWRTATGWREERLNP